MMSMQWEYNHQYGIHSLLATIPFMGIHHGTYEGEGISLQEMCSGEGAFTFICEDLSIFLVEYIYIYIYYTRD